MAHEGDFIAGEWTRAERPEGEIDSRSPADVSDSLGIHPFSRAQVDRAVQAARDAFPAWRRAGDAARRALLKRYQERLRANAAEIAETIAREIGKPRWEAKTEVDAMIGKVDLSLGDGAAWTADRRIEDLPGEIRFRPHGVVAVVGPFNFPGHLPNGQIVPALLLGNCVLFKPSDKGAASGAWIARCLEEAGAPAGVFNLVQGDARVAEAVVTHDGVDGILFTGSVAVGKRIVAANAARIDRVIALELGGKNASIVLDDCDLERTVRQLAFAAFATAGQRCTATSRVIVTRGIADRLADRLADAARRVVVGYPLEDGVFMGPVISESSRRGVLAAQHAARGAGFEALAPGGEVEVAGRRGWYLRPAVHRAPSAEVAARARDSYTGCEIFGPDLAVLPVADLDEAIALANDTPYGLSAAVYTSSREAFEEAADRVRVGVLHWNRSTAGASGKLPFGGIKESGNHRPAGILAGMACAYPLAVLLPPRSDEPLPSWPGLSF